VSVAPEVSTSPDLEPPVQSGTGSVPIAHKKVIAPIESTEPKQDLNTLLALEEAKEAAAAPPVPPTVVVSGTPAAAAPVPEAIPAPVVLPNNPLDPNSIAL
jgi:hypothetical protein